jgi:hypothetical protein
VVKILVPVAAVVLVAAACTSPAPTPSLAVETLSPTPTVAPRPSATRSLTPSPSPTPAPEADSCSLDPTVSWVIDPCPSMITAVHMVVASLDLPIARLVLQPDPFRCGDLWPGVQSPPICFGPFVMPGTQMHGWVSFRGSDKVAAVSLRLQGLGELTPPPQPSWIATIAAFQVPPAGWVMP